MSTLQIAQHLCEVRRAAAARTGDQGKVEEKAALRQAGESFRCRAKV